MTVAIEKFVFVDESAVQLNMQRDYAWSEVGTRAHVHKNGRRGRSYSLIADLSVHGIQAPFMIDGGVNINAFLYYVEEILLPNLRSGQIVVMDNCSAHNQAELKDIFENHDIELWFLPTYSPDLSPIELAFNNIKDALKDTSAQSLKTLLPTVMQAIKSISLADILAWFRLCGYYPH